MDRRAGSYGVDAPYVPIFSAIGFVLCVIGAVLSTEIFLRVSCGFFAVVLAYQVAQYMYTTKIGKFKIWDKLLDQAGLHGDERVLDIGCGRGLILNAAAARLPNGKAVGVDLWRSRDQSGNAPEVTQHNADLEGVGERIELHTEDMTTLSFPDDSFDLVAANAAIHNVPTAEGRAEAIREAYRVTKAGGRIIIADIGHTKTYASELTALGARDVTRKSAGPDGWFGGPWASTTVVAAKK